MRQRALAPLLVGRQPQLAELHECLARARAGAGHVVLLAGEAGVGKSRLLRELARTLAADSAVTIFTGHCYDERPAPPYGPFAELIERMDAAETPALADLRLLLQALAPLADGDVTGDPHAERRRLFHAIYQALRPAADRTHILVLEDLHWSDQVSQDLLLSLARAIEGDRLLIIGTFRTDEMHRLHPLAALIARLTRDRRYHELRLGPLSRPELAELLAITIGHHPQPELLAALYERTEGNPFFAEEVIEALLADGEPAPGASARQLSTTSIPLSIKDSILRRVADLDEPTTAILRAAAVIGRRFDFELLLRLTGLEEAALLRALAVLVERQLIVEEPTGPEDRYRFRHELIRAALYEEMLRRERRLRHLEVLRALEQLHAPDAGPVVDQLAYHALQARALPEAARYSRKAAERAARVHAYREALGHYEAALESGEQAGQLDTRERAELLARLGNSAYLIGDPRRAAGFWREALPLYEAGGERRRAADLLRWLGRSAWDTGKPDEAFELTHAALARLEGEEPCRELAMAYSALSHLYMFQIHIHGGKPDAAASCIAWGEQALAMAEALGDDSVITHALNNIGVALVDSGRPEQGLARLEQSLAIALRADLPADAVRAYINLGGKLSKVGRRQECLKLQREGYAFAARLGYIRGSGKLLVSICYNELEAGEWDQLELDLGAALRADRVGSQEERTQLQYIHANLLLERGRAAEARSLLEELLSATGDDPEASFMIEELLVMVYLELGEQGQAMALADTLLARLLAAAGPTATLADLAQQCFKLIAPIEAYLVAGRHADALAIIAALTTAAAQTSEPSLEQALATELRGLASLSTDPAEAAALLADARARYHALGCVPHTVRAHRRRAQALLQLGTPAARAQAQAELRTAHAIAEPLHYSYELSQIAALEQQLAPPRPARSLAAAGSGAISARSLDALTPREREVLALVTRGLSNRAIAAALVISEKTAEVHVRNILGKLGFSSRTQAATFAVEHGLVAHSA